MSLDQYDIVRVTCRFKDLNAGDIVNVFHFQVTSAGPVSETAVIQDIESVLDALYSAVAGQLNNDVDPYDIRLDLVEYSGGAEVVVRNIITEGWVLTTNPSSSGDAIPPMNAAIVNLRTTYPRVFGRKYLGVLGEGNTADGAMTSTALTAFGAWANGLIGTLTPGAIDYVCGVISAKAGSSNHFFAPFVGYVVNQILGTQRRRRKGKGS